MSKPRHFSGRLAALSSAAILAVYAVGYTVTEDAAQSAESGPAPTPTPRASADPTTSPTSTARGTSPAQTPTVTVQRATSTATPGASSGSYRDGTYVGFGTGRHGSIEATVTVEGGKITAVQISQCLTRYPCSRIGALPGQVVSRQSAQVDYVSGATDSSRSFIQAVTNALATAN
ncbi:MAG: FMN-binding protein [Dehalococcoidia bacterium]